jgi:hypothetical protein
LALCAALVSAEEVDLRSRELIRRDCRTEYGSQSVILFANGTVRLKETLESEHGLKLAELTPDEVEAFVRRVQDEDLTEVEEASSEVDGDWVEKCELHLRVDEELEEIYRFGRFGSLPLALSRVNTIVEDLIEVAEQRSPAGDLPPGYVPALGDVLIRVDGVRFEIVGFTSDRRGIEMSGVDQPLTIYILKEALGDEFTAVVKRRTWR